VTDILNASGCLDALTAPEIARQLDAFVTKTVTPLPREGNPPPRIAEVDGGMLNSIGLQNPGRERFLRDVLPELRALGIPLWVSVGGFSADEYAATCAELEDVTIELNLSCPNVDEAPESAAEIVAACRVATTLPLYAKLSPALPDIAARAVVAKQAGAAGVTVVNTLPAYLADRQGVPRLGNGNGGLSGPALLPVGVMAVRRIAERLPGFPVIGVGGIRSGDDARQYLRAGARLIAIGTAAMADPRVPERVVADLENHGD
jgi:dihydroorotate dehydrogenase (NAD+) catalytic subunit